MSYYASVLNMALAHGYEIHTMRECFARVFRGEKLTKVMTLRHDVDMKVQRSTIFFRSG